MVSVNNDLLEKHITVVTSVQLHLHKDFHWNLLFFRFNLGLFAFILDRPGQWMMLKIRERVRMNCRKGTNSKDLNLGHLLGRLASIHAAQHNHKANGAQLSFFYMLLKKPVLTFQILVAASTFIYLMFRLF